MRRGDMARGNGLAKEPGAGLQWTLANQEARRPQTHTGKKVHPGGEPQPACSSRRAAPAHRPRPPRASQAAPLTWLPVQCHWRPPKAGSWFHLLDGRCFCPVSQFQLCNRLCMEHLRTRCFGTVKPDKCQEPGQIPPTLFCPIQPITPAFPAYSALFRPIPHKSAIPDNFNDVSHMRSCAQDPLRHCPNRCPRSLT